jgi:hypothetical protein
VVLPEFLYLGQINESRATKMAKPVYPATAARSGFGGQVAVDVELDTWATSQSKGRQRKRLPETSKRRSRPEIKIQTRNDRRQGRQGKSDDRIQLRDDALTADTKR